MSFLKGLFSARSHIAFLVGLTVALTIIWHVDAANPKTTTACQPTDAASMLNLDPTTIPALKPTGVDLTDQERQWAVVAWTYFENNYQPNTGFVNSVDNYTSTTLWDQGSYLMALMAAEQLDLIDSLTFDERLQTLLASLYSMPLVDNLLPNKSYNTQNLAMVNYNNAPAPNGIGWSALDVARIGVPFSIIAWQYPEHTASIRAILTRWQLGELAAQGQLMGSHRTAAGVLERVQEGRFGYEEYAAKSLFLLGLDVNRAIRYDLDVAMQKVSGQNVMYDARMPAAYGGTHNAVLSEPYVLEALEFGLDSTTLPVAAAVFLAQQARSTQTGILTAVSEDNIDQAPYFVYNTVLNGGLAWAAFAPDGTNASAYRTLSLKAALGWSFIFDGYYADQLRSTVAGLINPQRGFYSGRYESNGTTNQAITANTNGIVLESLLYKVRGPLLRAARN